MAKLLTYANALDPTQLHSKVIEDGKINDIIDNIELSRELYDVVVSRNGAITTENFYVEDDDLVAISFRPKASVAALGGTILGYFGASAATLGISAAAFAVVSFAVGAVAMIGASLLMNAMFAPDAPSKPDSLESSPTYSWDAKRNTAIQGGAVPILYGTHRVTPPLIGKYIESIGTKQYVNLLYAVSDGYAEIDHDSVFVNGESISNYRGSTIYSRRGEIDQSPIGIFNSTRADKSVNKTMTKGGDYVYSETTGNNVTGLTVSLYVPTGLWRINDNGKTRLLRATISVEYLSHNDQWIPITTKVTDAIRVLGYWVRGYNYITKTYIYYKYATMLEADNAYSTGVYDGYVNSAEILPLNCVNVGDCTAEEEIMEYYLDGSGMLTDVCISYEPIFEERESYTYIDPQIMVSGKSQTPRRFTYNVSNIPEGQYQIRAKHYSSIIDAGDPHGDTFILDYLQEEIEDAFTYPTTSLLALRILATDQLSGSIPSVSVIASNSINSPAAACKDVLEKSGVTLNQNALDSFSDWEQHCNDKNYSCNVYIDSLQTVRKVLDIIAPLGRANVLQSGSNWRVIVDRADETPIQGFLFTMGNIVKDSFSETFLPIQDRANKIEITYFDKNYDYSPQILEVTNSTYDNAVEVNSSNITYIGCTDRDMAIKYAKYLLNNNRYLTITQSFQIDLEAIVARVGDIIKVAHDVPELSMASGRVISSTDTVVILDNEVDMEVGKSYYLEARRSSTNIIEMLEVVNSGTITNELTIVETITPLNQYDVYSFGELSRTSKKLRIINISNTSKLRSTITAIEYVPEVYNDTETIDVPIDGYFGIKHLRVDEYITFQGTSAIANVSASWVGESMWYDVYLNGEFNQRVFTSHANIENIPAPATIEIEIRDSFGDKEIITKGLLGRFAPPEPPTEFMAIQNDNIVRFSWIKSISLDTVRYEIRSGSEWDSARYIGSVGNVDTFEWFPDFNHTYNFLIKAIDETDVYSMDVASKLFTVSNINETLNIIYNYDGLDADAPPCGTAVGLVFVVGTGYVPIISARYSDLTNITYDDILTLHYDDEPSFESCSIDTNKIGLTKIRMLLEYTAYMINPTYDNISTRVYSDFPFDTYETITAINNIVLFYAVSDDAITYTDWTEYTGIVDETFRYIKFKYASVGEVNGDIEITNFLGFLDVPDVVFDIRDLVVNTSQSVLFSTYDKEFHSAPYVSVTTKTNTYGKITNITNLGFDISSYNPTDGTALVGTYDLNIKGY